MSIVDKASATVDKDRQKEYGDPVRNAVWQALVASVMEGRPVTPLEVNTANFAQKVVRMGIHSKEDTLVDIAGYADIRFRIVQAGNDGTIQKHVEALLDDWVDFYQRPIVPIVQFNKSVMVTPCCSRDLDNDGNCDRHPKGEPTGNGEL